jgi:hypothetical protein
MDIDPNHLFSLRMLSETKSANDTFSYEINAAMGVP